MHLNPCNINFLIFLLEIVKDEAMRDWFHAAQGLEGGGELVSSIILHGAYTIL